MHRKEHLASCCICTNRKFDFQHGIICSLTDKIADFEVNCDSFSLDKVEQKLIKRSAIEHFDSDELRGVLTSDYSFVTYSRRI